MNRSQKEHAKLNEVNKLIQADPKRKSERKYSFPMACSLVAELLEVAWLSPATVHYQTKEATNI